MSFDLKQKMEIILTVGQVLAENGSSVDRVIRSSKRVAEFMKIPKEDFHMQVTPSAIFLNISEDDKSNISKLRKKCRRYEFDNFTQQFYKKSVGKKLFAEKIQRHFG